MLQIRDVNCDILRRKRSASDEKIQDIAEKYQIEICSWSEIRNRIHNTRVNYMCNVVFALYIHSVSMHYYPSTMLWIAL